MVPNGLFQLLQAAMTHNGIGTGWTIYPPLSDVEYNGGPAVTL